MTRGQVHLSLSLFQERDKRVCPLCLTNLLKSDKRICPLVMSLCHFFVTLLFVTLLRGSPLSFLCTCPILDSLQCGLYNGFGCSSISYWSCINEATGFMNIRIIGIATFFNFAFQFTLISQIFHMF